MNTEAVIQQMLRSAFAGCTVLVIAHRINTILDSDYVLVLDAGQVAEFDRPSALLAQPSSMFAQLVAESARHGHHAANQQAL